MESFGNTYSLEEGKDATRYAFKKSNSYKKAESDKYQYSPFKFRNSYLGNMPLPIKPKVLKENESKTNILNKYKSILKRNYKNESAVSINLNLYKRSKSITKNEHKYIILNPYQRNKNRRSYIKQKRKFIKLLNIYYCQINIYK